MTNNNLKKIYYLSNLMNLSYNERNLIDKWIINSKKISHNKKYYFIREYWDLKNQIYDLKKMKMIEE